MNVVKEIARINEREARIGAKEGASWHDQYKDSAYVFVGGLDYEVCHILSAEHHSTEKVSTYFYS